MPMKRARLMALANSLCFRAETAVMREGTILPLSAIPGSLGALGADLGLLGLGLGVYGAVFAFVGAYFKRPLVIGLLFAFGWEQVVLALPGYLKQFTIAFYLQALVPHAMPSDGVASILQGMFRENPPVPVALAWLLAYLGVFLYLATRIVGRNEYVLDQ